MKICKRCNDSKLLTEFSIHKGFKDGRNSVCKICKAQEQRGREELRPYSYEKQIKTRYGLTIDDYNGILSKQNNCCAICKRPGIDLVVDHCHNTGIVRGLLCQRCNTGLGKFEDDQALLRNALTYLEG